MYVVLIIAVEWLLIRGSKITWLEIVMLLFIGGFINKFADKTVEFKNGRATTYLGGYDSYKEEKIRRDKNKNLF